MADKSEKLLQSIANNISIQNGYTVTVKQAIESSNQNNSIENKNINNSIKELKKAIENNNDNDGNDKNDIDPKSTTKDIKEGLIQANNSFWGVDGKAELFAKLDKIGSGFKNIKDGFKDLGKALALDKLGKKVGGFWDFLKKLFTVGLATIGFIKFLEGWNKANDWFEGNADFGDRIASALSNVVGSFLGWDEEARKENAKKLGAFFDKVTIYLSTEFQAIRDAINGMIDKGAFTKVTDGIRLILKGDILAGLSSLSSGLAQVATGIIDGESQLLKIVGLYFAAKGAFSLIKAVKGVGSALGTLLVGLKDLGQGLTGIGLENGGKKGKGAKAIGDVSKSSNIKKVFGALKGMGSFLGGLLGPLLLPILAGAALAAIIGLILKTFTDPTPSMMALKNEINDETISAEKIADGSDREYAKVKGVNSEGVSYETTVDKDTYDAIQMMKKELKNDSNSDLVKAQYAKDLDNKIRQFSKAAEIIKDKNDPQGIKETMSGFNNYKEYLDALAKARGESRDITEQRELIKAQYAANEAQKAGTSFQNFQNNQQTTNNILSAQLKPDVNKWSGYGGSLSPSH